MRQAVSPRSWNAGGAIHRVDFRERVLVVRDSESALSRATEDATKQLLVDAPAREQECSPRSRPKAPAAAINTGELWGLIRACACAENDASHHESPPNFMSAAELNPIDLPRA